MRDRFQDVLDIDHDALARGVRPGRYELEGGRDIVTRFS